MTSARTITAQGPLRARSRSLTQKGPARELIRFTPARRNPSTYFSPNSSSRVGLCNVVKTAVSMGVHRADGGSLLTAAESPASPATAARRRSAVLHARHGECVADDDGRRVRHRRRRRHLLPARSDRSRSPSEWRGCPLRAARLSPGAPGCGGRSCHLHPAWCAAPVRYGQGDGVTRERRLSAAGRQDGTANSFDFAAFGGYTPTLTGYVSMFNPSGPVTHPMVGFASCYRAGGGGEECPGQSSALTPARSGSEPRVS